ncbi:U11/U12 small nuclear ribonucleoprotein 48 kDa protein-like [Ornithodoros turicata]|uniref:U11/U12 small nuclear ribonucleoprotein 48 kDa protein-like n=1 Tax=Ornithodoros turicata TaxID=34597 RepID=UPI003138FC46
MAAVIEAREKQLRKIESFVNKTEKSLNSLLSSLNWTKERILKKVNYVTCPFDPGHKMPQSSLEKHVELCSWLRDGYSRSDKEKELPSSDFFYKNSTSVVPVHIDRETQQKILTQAAFRGDVPAEACQQVKDVPRTMERCFAEFTPSERFAIYDYVVECARAANRGATIRLEDLQVDFEKKPNADGEHTPSHLEIKSQMRDYKRRRQSYKGKNVHITRKSYTEVMKEVIENQTEYLKQTMSVKGENDQREPSERVRSRTPEQSPPPPDDEEMQMHKRRRSRSPQQSREERRSHKHRSRDREHKKRSHKHHKKHKKRSTED